MSLTPGRLGYESTKRLLDLVGATAGILLTWPLMAGAAVAIQATMGVPVLFRQTRPGRDGEPFELLKFRTMCAMKPGENSVKSDAVRLTTVGRFLRSSSIDELPTLLNVLRGEMR